MIPNFLLRLRQELTRISVPAATPDRRRSSRPVRDLTVQQLELRSLLSATAVMVEDAIPGGGIYPGAQSSSPFGLENVSGTLFFQASDGTNGSELWRLNTSGVAEMVEDAMPGGGIAPAAASSSPSQLANVNGRLFFAASDGVNGTELWRLNNSGIAELVEDAVAGGGINPGIASSYPRSLTNVNGTLFFSADDGINGRELWRLNSSGVAEMVEDAIPGGGINPTAGSSSPLSLTNMNGTLFFSADDGVNGRELWRLNSSGVAEMVEDAIPGGGINPGAGSSSADFLTNAGGTLFFNAFDDANGLEVWRLNNSGVAEIVEDAIPGGGIAPGAASSSPGRMVNVNGRLFFAARDGVNGRELWRLNNSGIAELVEDAVAGGGINPGIADSFPSYLTDVNGILFFKANDGFNGSELWRLNNSGVAELVEDAVAGGGIRPGAGASDPGELKNVNGRLFFTADDGTNGRELWNVNSSGVAELIEDSVPLGGIRPGSGQSRPKHLTTVNGTLFFSANDGTNGYELWSLDVSEPFQGTSANDAFVLTYTNTTITVTISINGGAPSTLATLPAGTEIALSGGGGTDSVRVNGTTAADVIQVAGSGLLVNGAVLRLDTTESLVLASGAGDDTYRFDADSPLGTITLDESLAGADTLDFSLTTTAAVSINLGLATTQIVNSNLSLILGSTTAFENVIGGTVADSLTGNTVNNSITGGGGNDTLNGFTGSDTLAGGLGDDTYTFGLASAGEVDTLIETAGQGNDTINFGGISTAVTANLGTVGTQAVHTNRSIALNLNNTFENLTGGSAADSLTGNTGNNSITGNSGSDTLNGFTGSDTLAGGIGDDTYAFGLSSAGEIDRLTELTGQGADFVNFAGVSTPLTVNLGTDAVQSVHTNRSIQLNLTTTFENLAGGSAADSLTGNSQNNSIIGNAGNDTLNGFTGSDTLAGGLDNDTYSFGIASAGEVDTLTETTGQGTDTLNFAGISTAVTVNLGITTSQAVHTSRSVLLSSGTTFENATGGSAADVLRGNSLANTLVGNGGTDILVGLGGNDTLSGGAANDILVGGREADTLKGDQAEDMLIAGFTLSAGVEDSAAFVQTIATTWFGAGAFAARVSALAPILIPTSTVLTDTNTDILSSDADGNLDLLFAALVDSVSKDAGDILTLL